MKITTLGLSPPEKRFNPLENPSVPFNEGANWLLLGGGHSTDSGELITDATALRISTVYACIRVLSEAVASLPLRLLRVTDKGRVQEVNDPLRYLLSLAPNEEMTAFSYFETVTAHLNLAGNSYSEIQRASDGRPVALWPLSPRLTRPLRLTPESPISYETTDGGRRNIDAKNMLHIPLTTWDGHIGLSPIMQAAQSLGLAAAAERYGARVFSNGSVPMVAMKTSKMVKPEDKQKMRHDWEMLQQGTNQHRVAILDQDLQIEKLGISPEEAQFLETRKYQRADIAAIFRVPAHMIGEQQKLSNSNVEQINLDFVTSTLKPLLGRIEAEIVKKLLTPEPGKVSDLTVQFDLSERLRGDWASLTSGIANGRQWGTLTTNEARKMLGLNPIDGALGDVLLNPVNMQNAERLLDPPASSQTAVSNNEE